MPRLPPRYWWDFVGDDHDVVAQSDWPGGESLAVFKAPPGQETRGPQIAQALELIEEFKSGRKTPNWGQRTT